MTAPQRSQLVQRLERRLLRRRQPRLEMSLLVAVTAGVGFLASYLLLRAGMHAMWLRYVVALCGAYIAFLALLRMWLHARRDDWHVDGPDAFDWWSAPDSNVGAFEGGGGRFGGAGASGSWDTSAPVANAATPIAPSSPAPHAELAEAASSGPDGFDAFDVAAAIPLLLGAALLAVLGLSAIWVVYSAPVLFAELLLDGVLAASLYRRLRTVERQHWLTTTLRRTWMPFALTALILSLTGWGLSLHTPGARSIGEVFASQRP
jgi:hypothetical protein